MELIINRMLFSLYCLENSIAGFFDNFVYKRLMICFCKFLYRFDFFGNISKNNISFDEYVNHTFDSAKEATENVDYGLSIVNSQGALCVVLFPFILSILFLLNYIFVSLFFYIKPILLITVSLALSYFICYVFSFRDNKYKVYFAKFRKSKCNKKWHMITTCICCFAIIVFYFSFIFPFKNGCLIK